MADVLSCYGPDLDALADSVGEVKPFVSESWEAWFAARWRSFADAVGFRSQADQLIHTAIVTKGQFGSIKTVLANGLADWIEKRPASLRCTMNPGSLPPETTSRSPSPSMSANWNASSP